MSQVLVLDDARRAKFRDMAKRPRMRLHTLEGVRREAERVYRSMKAGRVDPEQGKAMLAALRETRLTLLAIERSATGAIPGTVPSGGAPAASAESSAPTPAFDDWMREHLGGTRRDDDEVPW